MVDASQRGAVRKRDPKPGEPAQSDLNSQRDAPRGAAPVARYCDAHGVRHSDARASLQRTGKLRENRGETVVARYCDADSLSCPTTEAPCPALSTASTNYRTPLRGR
jgi:hypothetical protein